MAPTEYELVESETGRIVLRRLRLATTWWQRLQGLQFHGTIAADSGLLLAPCNSVHTCFMRFALDVAMLDENGTVLVVYRNIRPWRAIFPRRGAAFVLETAGGTLAVAPGAKLAIIDRGRKGLPRCVVRLAAAGSLPKAGDE